MSAYNNQKNFGGDRGQPAPQVLFKPETELKELVDKLAEEQAERLEINSNQLRKFFSEVKNLYNQYKAKCKTRDKKVVFSEIEPHLKMIRSKAFYASRPGGQSTLDRSFKDFLDKSISQVNNADAFEKFVMHFEAVVGFMYGKGKVKK